MKHTNFKKLLVCLSLFFFSYNLLANQEQQKIIQFFPTKNIRETVGIIPFNKDFFTEICRLFDIDVFVETGTFRGDTCALAAQVFKKVYSVELSEALFKEVSQRFVNTSNVSLYQGDSGTVMSDMLAHIGIGPKVAILLDSHWSGGNTAKGFDVPILRELSAIKKSGIRNSIILIDDIRCFQKALPQYPDPYNYYYPDLIDLIDYIHEINPHYICITYGDLLMAYTDQDIIIPQIAQAMTISRLNLYNDSILSQAETVIANASNADFYYLSWMANILDYSTGYWRTPYYNFWYALALYQRGYKNDAYNYMKEACRVGFARAQHYLSLWK